MKTDFWKGKGRKAPNFAKGDTISVYHSDRTGGYFGIFRDKNGKGFGDYKAEDSIEIEEYFTEHGGEAKNLWEGL